MPTTDTEPSHRDRFVVGQILAIVGGSLDDVQARGESASTFVLALAR